MSVTGMEQAHLGDVQTENGFALFLNHVTAKLPSLTPDGFVAGLIAFRLSIIKTSLSRCREWT